jgi:hypothetical protein
MAWHKNTEMLTMKENQRMTILCNLCEFDTSHAEFTIVSSSSSTLEETVRVSEEPKEYIANRSEDIF